MTAFTRLDASSADHWAVIAAEHRAHYARAQPLGIIDQLRALDALTLGFPCTQLQHALMTATLARRSGADAEAVVIALCHDLGKALSVPNHAAIGAELLRPYVSDDGYRAVLHHQEFQGRYYFQHFGAPTTMRDGYAGEGWYALCARLVDEWDMPAFDPDFAVDPLDSFEPEVLAVFSQPKMM